MFRDWIIGGNLNKGQPELEATPLRVCTANALSTTTYASGFLGKWRDPVTYR